MVTFQDVIIYLQNVGVADVLLPFILVFTIIFAIMEKVKILGEKSRRYNVMIAIVIGLAVVIPHILSPSQYDVVNIMNRALPNVSIFIVAIVAVLLLVGVIWPSKQFKFGATVRGWFTLIAFIIVVAIFTYAAGWWGPFGAAGYLPTWLYFLQDPGTIALIVIILIFIIIIAYISGGEEGKEGERREKGWKKFIESLGGEEEK